MANHFGPWANSIDLGANPRLSAFWKRRLQRLESASRTSSSLARRHLLGIAAAAMAIIVLPTFQSGPVAAKSAVAADEKGLVKDSEKQVLPHLNDAALSGKSFIIKVRLFDDQGLVVSEPILVAPKDNEVSMESSSQTPFVIGLSAAENEQRPQPHIVVLKEGVVMKATVIGAKADGATLDITVERSKIGDVETQEIGPDEKIQLPSIDIRKKRIITYRNYGTVFGISLEDKTAKGNPRIELVFGPAEMEDRLAFPNISKE